MPISKVLTAVVPWALMVPFRVTPLDVSPVGAFVDAAVVAQVSDATLLVVREGFVERASVQKAAEQLRAAGANLVGTVMNCCDTATSAYYAAYGDKAE